VFLLLPTLLEAPIEAGVCGWPDMDNTPAFCIVRFLLYLRCCGAERAERASSDPLLRDLFFIPPSCSTSDLVAWQQSISEEDIVALHITLAEWGGQGDEISREDLTVPPSLRPSTLLDSGLTVAAAAIMRSFARRLPGFASSSLPFLYSNFLDISASLDEEAERRVVRLGRPPLAVILSVNGMFRSTYRLRWLDNRPFSLFPQE